MNERSLLPVVVPALDLATLTPRFCDALAAVLAALGVPGKTIEAELREMEHFAYGPTMNRRLHGSANLFMDRLDMLVHRKPKSSLKDVALRLAEFPCKPLGYKFPREVAVELLCADRKHRTQLH